MSEDRRFDSFSFSNPSLVEAGSKMQASRKVVTLQYSWAASYSKVIVADADSVR